MAAAATQAGSAVPHVLVGGDYLLRRPPAGAHYDKDRADRVVRFINNLRHLDGEWAGRRFNLRPWQEAIIRTVFGTVWDESGYRVIRTLYIEIPRKNGKSELAAAVALYLLLGDREPGAQIYSAAADRTQASLVFNVAASMVEKDATLKKRCRIFRSTRNLTHPASGSFYRAIPAIAGSKHGFNAHGVIYDELHTAKDRELWDVLTTSTGARRQSLVMAITTAGFDRTSICWEQHQYAVKVRDGIVDDPSFLPVLYTAPEGSDWTDPAVWAACNPALGDFRYIEELRSTCEKAKVTPGLQNGFRRLYLCQWTENANRWLSIARWDEGPGEFSRRELRGRRAWGGLDLSSTTDLAAWALFFPNADVIEGEEGGIALVHHWIPEENVIEGEHRTADERTQYLGWIDLGYLETTEGNVIDYDTIKAQIEADGEIFDIQAIAVDRWNSTQLVTQLMGAGFTIEPWGQGFASMSAPSKELQRLVAGAWLNHGSNPLLRWEAANAAIVQDAAENIKPVKPKEGARIDGIIALIMAIGVWMVARGEAPPPNPFHFDRDEETERI